MNLTQTNNNRGFTLVELLVVLAISGIILTSIMQIFTNSQVIYNVQEEVAEMQQNVRTAKMFLERDVRMAGSGALDITGPNKKPILPLEFDNDHLATGTDRLTVLYNLPDGNPCGDVPTHPATMLCSDLPTLTLVSTMPDTSTVANIAENLSLAPYSSWMGTCSCNGTIYTPKSDKTPLILSSPDKSSSSILIATGFTHTGGTDKFSNGPNIKHTALPAGDRDALYNFFGEKFTTDLKNKLANESDAGSTINFFTPAQMQKPSYYVKTVDGISALYRDTATDPDEVLAEHIEDLQFAFVMKDGSEINNLDLTTKAEISDVRLVRIQVLGRSAHPHVQGGAFSGQRPELEDHTPAGPADNFRRRQLTVTVKVRNFDLN